VEASGEKGSEQSHGKTKSWPMKKTVLLNTTKYEWPQAMRRSIRLRRRWRQHHQSWFSKVKRTRGDTVWKTMAPRIPLRQIQNTRPTGLRVFAESKLLCLELIAWSKSLGRNSLSLSLSLSMSCFPNILYMSRSYHEWTSFDSFVCKVCKIGSSSAVLLLHEQL
jgi:hypothetical protein